MFIEAVKGINKKEQVNAVGMEANARDLSGLDSFIIHGAMVYEITDNTTGQVRGVFALKTDAGMYTGIAKNVYNACKGMLAVYSDKDFKAGISAKMHASELDSDKAYMNLELL